MVRKTEFVVWHQVTPVLEQGLLVKLGVRKVSLHQVVAHQDQREVDRRLHDGEEFLLLAALHELRERNYVVYIIPSSLQMFLQYIPITWYMNFSPKTPAGGQVEHGEDVLSWRSVPPALEVHELTPATRRLCVYVVLQEEVSVAEHVPEPLRGLHQVVNLVAHLLGHLGKALSGRQLVGEAENVDLLHHALDGGLHALGVNEVRPVVEEGLLELLLVVVGQPVVLPQLGRPLLLVDDTASVQLGQRLKHNEHAVVVQELVLVADSETFVGDVV
ncbi:hypothetical protein NQ318_020064 [Aromia moschata]|uniref:Uncharacterized protein n=1 Tax=Aromia moschata TaxID=1265417 RepID=A0AAV8ZB09_9CUCU|nr:hypothetical protein NQ318_020064 [Aromia moschata]